MTTYKRLGLKVQRTKTGWLVTDNMYKVSLHEGNGNKGQVVLEALKVKSDVFVQEKGKWQRIKTPAKSA